MPMLAEKGCQMKLAKAGTRKRKGLFIQDEQSYCRIQRYPKPV
jgi:hypothetical protein